MVVVLSSIHTGVDYHSQESGAAHVLKLSIVDVQAYVVPSAPVKVHDSSLGPGSLCCVSPPEIKPHMSQLVHHCTV